MLWKSCDQGFSPGNLSLSKVMGEVNPAHASGVVSALVNATSPVLSNLQHLLSWDII